MKRYIKLALPSSLLMLIFAAQILPAQTPGRSADVLTIDEAVRIATERSLSILQSQTSVESAGARVTGAFGTFLPQISVTGGYNHQLSEGTRFVDGIAIPNSSDPSSTYSVGAAADLQLFDGFSRTANYKAAQSEYSASLQTLNRSRQDVAFQARSAFLNALRTEQIIEVRRSELEVSRERLANVQAMVEAGSAQIGSVYTQEAEVANNELLLVQAETDALVALNTLKLAMNVDPSSDFRLSAEGLARSVDSAEIAVTRAGFGTLAQMLERQHAHRVDIQAARLRAEAASSSVTSARSGYFPQISSGIRWDWQKSGPVTSSLPQLNLNLRFTPFDQFRTNEQVQLADAQRVQAEIEGRRLELQARSDLQQAIARLDGAERQIAASQKSMTAARQSRYAADERYRLGAGSYTDYLVANNQYLSAQINQVNAVFNYRLAVFDVLNQLGE